MTTARRMALLRRGREIKPIDFISHLCRQEVGIDLLGHFSRGMSEELAHHGHGYSLVQTYYGKGMSGHMKRQRER